MWLSTADGKFDEHWTRKLVVEEVSTHESVYGEVLAQDIGGSYTFDPQGLELTFAIDLDVSGEPTAKGTIQEIIQDPAAGDEGELLEPVIATF